MTDELQPEHNDGIPYYHTNINENQEEIVTVILKMLDEHSKLTETYVGEFPVVVREVEWETPELAASYSVSQFIPPFSEQYGDHVMLSVTDYFGDEFEERIYAFSRDEKTNRINMQTNTISLTAEHQKEHDEWFEKNSKPTEDGGYRFAILPDSTDDIAYRIEMLLQAVQTGYSKITNDA